MNYTTSLTCPQCGGYIIRIPRHTSDRLISIFGSVHRYRCQYFPCQWEGRVRMYDYSIPREAGEIQSPKTGHM